MQYKNKTELCEQDNQIVEVYWNELCDAVDKVCEVPSDENIQKMDGLKNKITKFYNAHNKKIEAMKDFEKIENDCDIIDDIKLQVSQKEIEKTLSDKDIASMLEDNIEFNNALLFSNVKDESGLIKKHINADEKRLAALKDFIETDDNKEFVVPDIPPFEPYIKS